MKLRDIYTELFEVDPLLPMIFSSVIVNGNCDAKYCSCRARLKESLDMKLFIAQLQNCTSQVRSDSLASLSNNPVIDLAATNYINVGIAGTGEPSNVNHETEKEKAIDGKRQLD